MGTKLATGLSKGKNGTVAAKEAVLRAKEKLGGGRVDLSIVYSSSDYDHREVVDVVREATDNALLIGASTAGEFTEERVERGSVAVGLLSSDDIKIFTALAEGVKEDPEGAIKEVIAELYNCRFSNYLDRHFLIKLKKKESFQFKLNRVDR